MAKVTCPNCHGTNNFMHCIRCLDTGLIFDHKTRKTTTCPRCHGSPNTIPCHRCKGTGKIKEGK